MGVEAVEELKLVWLEDGSYVLYLNNQPFPFFLTEFPMWEQLNGSGVYEITLKFVAHRITQVNNRTLDG